jgi:hypothetical protein
MDELHRHIAYSRLVQDYIQLGKLYKHTLSIEDKKVREQAQKLVGQQMTVLAKRINDAVESLASGGQYDNEIDADDWANIIEE